MNFYDYNLNKIKLYIYVIMEIEMKPSLIVPNVGLKKLGVLIKYCSILSAKCVVNQSPPSKVM